MSFKKITVEVWTVQKVVYFTTPVSAINTDLTVFAASVFVTNIARRKERLASAFLKILSLKLYE